MIEWYPFNIFGKTKEGDLILHVFSNNKWSEKLYDKTLNVIEKDTSLDWDVRLDGPYGNSSNIILETSHAIFVGAGHGISRLAPILQDIVTKLKTNPGTLSLKKIDLHWIIEDETYFEWFIKLLNELKNESDIFNYNIYFPDKSPAFNEKLMYMATDVGNKTQMFL